MAIVPAAHLVLPLIAVPIVGLADTRLDRLVLAVVGGSGRMEIAVLAGGVATALAIPLTLALVGTPSRGMTVLDLAANRLQRIVVPRAGSLSRAHRRMGRLSDFRCHRNAIVSTMRHGRRLMHPRAPCGCMGIMRSLPHWPIRTEGCGDCC